MARASRGMLTAAAILCAAGPSPADPAAPVQVTIKTLRKPSCVAPGERLGILAKVSATGLAADGSAHWKTTWSIEQARPETCVGSFANPASRTTDYLAPRGCTGSNIVKLTLEAEGAYYDDFHEIRIGCREGEGPVEVSEPGSIVAAAPPGTGDPGTSPFPYSPGGKITSFQQERSGFRALFTVDGDKLAVTLSTPARGFGGVCVERQTGSIDVSRNPELVMELRVTKGRDLPFHIKLEKPDSSCRECQCWLSTTSADGIGAGSQEFKQVVLPIQCPGDLERDVRRICIAANADDWGRPGTIELSLRDLRLTPAR